MSEQSAKVPYQFGTMIEVPRAALVADHIAEYAEFFSFGTNDLTQTTFGISRDDAETGFLSEYLQKGILTENPFAMLDKRGVGRLMEIGVKLGRGAPQEPGDRHLRRARRRPEQRRLLPRAGLDYVSCSPFRVPVARLAAAHAALAKKGTKRDDR